MSTLWKGPCPGPSWPHTPLQAPGRQLPSLSAGLLACPGRLVGSVLPVSMWEASLHLLDTQVIPCHPSDKYVLGCDPILEVGTLGSGES